MNVGEEFLFSVITEKVVRSLCCFMHEDGLLSFDYRGPEVTCFFFITTGRRFVSHFPSRYAKSALLSLSLYEGVSGQCHLGGFSQHVAFWHECRNRCHVAILNVRFF